MEQENQGKNQSLAQMELSMPRFDEEATVLHARQVVPLIEVKRQARWRRGLLALVGLITLLGGAIYGRLSNLPPVEKETQNQTIPTISGHLPHVAAPTGAAGGFSSENSVSTPTAHPDVEEIDFEAPNPLGHHPPDLGVTSNTDRNSYGQNDSRPGDGRRHDRPRERQNLREERVRRQKAENSDDLFRIQEIFEGRQTQPN